MLAPCHVLQAWSPTLDVAKFQSYHNLISLFLHPLLVFHTLIVRFAYNASTTYIYVEAPRILW